MNDVEVLVEIISRFNLTSIERSQLIHILWQSNVEHQDWGYGCDEQIQTTLLTQLAGMRELIIGG